MLDKNLKTETCSIIRQVFINKRELCLVFILDNFKRNLYLTDLELFLVSMTLLEHFDNIINWPFVIPSKLIFYSIHKVLLYFDFNFLGDSSLSFWLLKI